MRRALGVILLLATACTHSPTDAPAPRVTAPIVVSPSPVSVHGCIPPACHIVTPAPAPTYQPRPHVSPAPASRSRSTTVHKPVHGAIMHVTGYCTGQITASGKRVAPGMVAVINYGIPFGTKVHVEGKTTSVGYWDHSYVVEDHIGHGSQIDIYFSSCAFARKFGKQYLHVTFSH